MWRHDTIRDAVGDGVRKSGRRWEAEPEVTAQGHGRRADGRIGASDGSAAMCNVYGLVDFKVREPFRQGMQGTMDTAVQLAMVDAEFGAPTPHWRQGRARLEAAIQKAVEVITQHVEGSLKTWSSVMMLVVRLM